MDRQFIDHIFDPNEETNVGAKLLNLLALVRKHLDMEVAFISEFVGNDRVFKLVDKQTSSSTVCVGNSDVIKETYCQKIADNQLDPIITDTKANPITNVMPITKELNIGCYIGVPIVLSDGGMYGTFCCYKSHPDDSLNGRDLTFLTLISEVAAELIEKNVQFEMLNKDAKLAIENVIKTKGIDIYFQPIFSLNTNKISGFEALSRFTSIPYRTPDIWFNEAAQLGLGEPLEMLAIQNTLDYIDKFDKATYISINTAPEHILSGAIARVFEQVDCNQIVLELTEHTQVLDYPAMREALKPLRIKGMRLAIDDAGAGFSSFQHILELEADIIKLDISLTQNINKERSKYLLAKALCGFAKAINCIILAEGVETQDELDTLRVLGVDKVQGYLLGRPAPFEDVVKYQTTTLLNKLSE
ncbi:EAL domain-containing protein [Colwellia sp. 6M3]|uniref:sensor domain-containing phosphodiesterase n=1 Tax=Colwellia sp. 6M3 TaxID=2759849 RepID=UPI0015F624C0|nr:EAL domain-containing protein [Colwellia sp. 6M3]MBA6415040.1 EAL domain-containing protein [Colwellia sp. 6M3]